jgi:DNA-binding CsgD family transcriptional regulator
MTSEGSDFNILPASPRAGISMDKLSRLQAELVSEALKRAIDDTGAAMAHQLSEPLTALLLYLHDIKQAGEHRDGTEDARASLSEMVDMALCETERICAIVGRVVPIAGATVDTEAAVIRGFAAIESWTRNGQFKSAGHTSTSPARTAKNPLTPREHEVLSLITGGSSNKEGGYRLGISTRTFEAHRANVMAKVGARNAADLIRKTSQLDDA